MRLLRSVVFTAFLLACAALASAQVAGGIVGTPPGPPQAPQVTGTAQITGQVVAADNGVPVKRAVIMLFGAALVPRPAASSASGPAPGSASVTTVITSGASSPTVRMSPASKQTETDDGGQFQFTQLPAGQYTITVSPKTAFARTEHPENVRLADGQSATVTIKLARTGVVTGRVFDESGEPLMRAQVSALRRDSTTGGRLVWAGMGAMATTDDRGHFRLYDLPPGEYYVKATYMQGGPPAAERPRIGYGPTFYPGVLNVEAARRVTVRSAQETEAIEFTMQRVALGRLYGIATDSAGRPLGQGSGPYGGSVMIASREDPSSGRGPGLKQDGSFDMRDVTPGDYYLVATLQHGTGPDAEREAAYVPFSINGDEVNINIQTNKGATLSGTVLFEGPDTTAAIPANAVPPRAVRRRTTISVRPDYREQMLGIAGVSRSVEVAEDGTFELTGVRGPVFLNVMSARGVVKSVLRTGQDVTAKPMTFQGTEHVTDLVVVVTSETASIQGMVTDSRGEPARGTTVVIFPDDPERWYQGSPFVFVSRTVSETPAMPASASSAPGMPLAAGPAPGVRVGARWLPVPGAFLSPRLLPGRYWVATAAALPQTAFDRDTLEKLRATATSVTVTPGEATTVQLKLMK